MLIIVYDGVDNIVEKGENTGYQHFLLFPQCFHFFLAPLAEGQRAIVMLCPSCVRPSVILPETNFSSETTDWIFTKFHMYVP